MIFLEFILSLIYLYSLVIYVGIRIEELSTIRYSVYVDPGSYEAYAEGIDYV